MKNLINEKKPFLKLYLCVIISITITLLILRVVFSYISYSEFGKYGDMIEARDVDFRILYALMRRGIFKYYNIDYILFQRALYLYHWYFIFFPFYLIPLDISVYIWDALRFISTIYIANNIYKITNKRSNVFYLFFFTGTGYFVDMYLNNTNWLITFLIFAAYLQVEEDRKWLAGILFALATFKVFVIFFPLILLISKKIKLKDLVYFIIPLIIICLPYIIFPEYLNQMLDNWLYNEDPSSETFPFLIQTYLLSWQLFQTAQLMVWSFMFFIFLSSIKDEIWNKRYVILITLVTISACIYFLMFSYYYYFILKQF